MIKIQILKGTKKVATVEIDHDTLCDAVLNDFLNDNNIKNASGEFAAEVI